MERGETNMYSQVVIKVDVNEENAAWSSLNYKEKNWVLFLRQKTTLDTFLDRGAISQAQHDKSLHDLMEKMGVMGEVAVNGKQV